MGSDQADDEALVASRIDGAQFDRVFELRAREIWRYLAAHLGPPAADDLLSEVFARAFAARARFNPDRGTARAWLYGIATNVCLEAVRRRSNVVDWLDSAQPLSVERDVADTVALRDALQRAIAQLPDDRRAVLLLIGAAGLSYSEAAKALDLPLGTVRSRFFRARRQLRRLLVDEEKSEDGTRQAS